MSEDTLAEAFSIVRNKELSDEFTEKLKAEGERWVRLSKRDPIRGDDGYPTERELNRVKRWPLTRWLDLMEYVRVRWSYQFYWSEQEVTEYGQKNKLYSFSTGGWSGNESLVGALEQNRIFHAICAVSWKRGGHYEYEVRVDAS